VLLAERGRFPGVLGSLAELLTVQDGAEEAITAALGAAAGAVAVADLEAAVAILTSLKGKDAGQVGLVIAGTDGPDRPFDVPPGIAARRAVDLVTAPRELAGAARQLLDGVVVTDDLGQGIELIRAQPRLRVVTTGGDLIGAHWAHGGSAGAPSLLGLRAAAQEAAARLSEAEHGCARAERELAAAAEDEDLARQDLAEAQVGLQEVDAAAAETSGRLGNLAGAARAAQDEVRRLSIAIEAADRSREKDLEHLADLQGKLAVQEAQGGSDADGDEEPGDDAAAGPDKDALAAEATAARDAEMEARLDVRTVEERLRAVAGRGDALASAATAERQAIQLARVRAERRARQAAVARAVASAAQAALAAIERSRAMADAERLAAERASRERGGELKDVRARIRDLASEHEAAVSSAHGAEIERAGRRMRLEQTAAKAAEDFSVDPDTLIAEYGPTVEVPPAEEGQPPVPYDRAATEKRAQSAQRMLDQLGKVNPLALEEFSALEERHAFLSTQLEDLRSTRRDLLTVVKEVDDRVQQVFASAYEDTAREFEDIIGRLFPGGEGRLVLTEPDDLLATGIEIEARPPGKKVKRLSLLSGGERALTAIAFLLAIFKARPSPFYLLDEVEAALDDTNLQRLLGVFTELRDTSQLIIITHQRRTMEIADTLYGVSMRGDGVSTVVSQRLREPESA